MPTSTQTLIDLETKFWQSMVNQDTDTALDLLSEPALMVSSHGAMNDTSTWVQNGDRWKCVMHTETPANTKQTTH